MGEPRNGGLVDSALDEWNLKNYIFQDCKLVWVYEWMAAWGEPRNGGLVDFALDDWKLGNYIL